MIKEPDIAQEIYTAITEDLFLSPQGKRRHRFLAEKAARRIMPMIRAERELLERRRSRVVMVDAIRRLENAGD